MDVSNRTTARADRAIAPGVSTKLTPEQLVQLAPLIRDAMKDKSYQLTPIGMQVAAYLQAKRKRLSDESYRDYESGLDKLARYFPDLRAEDFEPPTAQNVSKSSWTTNGATAPRTRTTRAFRSSETSSVGSSSPEASCMATRRF